MAAKPISIGSEFGRLIVSSDALQVPEKNGRLTPRRECVCVCGKKTIVREVCLRAGNGTRSCGCLGPETVSVANQTHGHKRFLKMSPTYVAWNGMKGRCADLSNIDYGGRGIKVCERWKKFENFIADMGERPVGMTIDRIDANGNYEKVNCKWSTVKQQNRNKSNNVILEINGIRKCIAQWAEDEGLPFSTVYSRTRKGWSPIKAVFTPILFKGNRVRIKKAEVSRG